MDIEGFCHSYVATLSLHDRCYSVSRVFIGQCRKNSGAVNIYLSLTHAHTLIQSEALPVTFISVITMDGRMNGKSTHYNGDTHAP